MSKDNLFAYISAPPSLPLSFSLSFFLSHSPSNHLPLLSFWRFHVIFPFQPPDSLLLPFTYKYLLHRLLSKLHLKPWTHLILPVPFILEHIILFIDHSLLEFFYLNFLFTETQTHVHSSRHPCSSLYFNKTAMKTPKPFFISLTSELSEASYQILIPSPLVVVYWPLPLTLM